MTRLLPPTGADPRDIIVAVNQALKGKINSCGTVTLTAGAATTTVTNQFVGVDSVVLLFPQKANAAAVVASTYVDPADYVSGTSFLIRHPNNANVDKTFGFLIVG